MIYEHELFLYLLLFVMYKLYTFTFKNTISVFALLLYIEFVVCVTVFFSV